MANTISISYNNSTLGAAPPNATISSGSHTIVFVPGNASVSSIAIYCLNTSVFSLVTASQTFAYYYDANTVASTNSYKVSAWVGNVTKTLDPQIINNPDGGIVRGGKPPTTPPPPPPNVPPQAAGDGAHDPDLSELPDDEG